MKWKLPNYLYLIEWEISVIDDKTFSTFIQKSQSASQMGEYSLKNEKEETVGKLPNLFILITGSTLVDCL